MYGADEAPAPSSGARFRALGSTVVGAVLAVGLLGGSAYWLMNLGEREAASLPVFRAQAEPAKVRPDDPGGAETPYQQIRSYEVAIDGAGLEPTETRLAPGPEAPRAEDLAMGELGQDGAGAAEDNAAGAATGAGGVTPPPPRPSDLVERTAAASQQAIDDAAQLATSAALSPIQIQLGAFTDRAFTESEWHRISAANEDILTSRALAIQSTVSGGQTYYRLRVGPFRDRAEANSVCEALKARGQDCLVAVNG